MKKVLIITYYFPPMGGGGVLRIQKFAKYLPKFDWEPIVLTATVNGLTTDDSLLKELNSHIQVIRTAPSLLDALKFSLLRHVFPQSHPSEKKLKDLPYDTTRQSKLYPLVIFLEKLKRRIESWVLLPDQQVLWVGAATKLAQKIMQEHHIDAIITSGPPHSAHLVGLKLFKLYNTPWLVDFRDDWVNNPLFMPTSKIGGSIIKKMERRVVAAASKVITVTPPLRDKIYNRYTHQEQPNKFKNLWNGYDTEDFLGTIKSHSQHREFQIMYFGSYGRIRTTPSLVLAFQRLKRERPDLFSFLHITFVGQFTDDQDKWREMLNNQINFVDHLPHKSCIEQMRQADALLLFLTTQEDGPTNMTGKIFEYYAAQRPIIALLCPGVLKQFISDRRLGYVADIENSKELFQLWVTVLQQWKEKNGIVFSPNTSDLYAFSREALTQELAGMLEEISASHLTNHDKR